MFTLSYYIAITVADFIDALVSTFSVVSLLLGIGAVSGTARKKKKSVSQSLCKILVSRFSVREN